MAPPLKLTSKERTTLLKLNKEKIRVLVSRGLELKQIEEKLHEDGCRITAPLREFIIWEKHFPEVKELLEQGLDVPTIEERMRLNGWIWTDNLKNKALWEFHREEIIRLYKSLRSVESVQEIMVRKGFLPQTRIYYTWLHDWGVPTNINRTNLSGLDPYSYESPFDSNSSATPGSPTGPYYQIQHESTSLEVSHSSPDNESLPRDTSQFSIALSAPDEEEGLVNLYQPGGGQMDVDSEYESRSDQLALYSDIGNALTSQQITGASMTDRFSLDSGYASRKISMQSSAAECPSLSLPTGDLGNSLNRESDDQERVPQAMSLHSISCPENHEGPEFSFHCCGSSCLQELARFATTIPPGRVYELLCNYMRYKDVRLFDNAGNTFLHKLAVTGAPWAYFEAAFKAHVDPCHLNAYGQTFAHALNVSKFHDKLIECLSFIRGLGIDFGRRDASGRTILHCLYDQPISPQTAREILKLIETPGRHLSLRDVSGRTPCDIFKQSFQRQASTNRRWSSPELQLQNFGIFEDILDDGVLRLSDESIDWQRVTNNPDELRATLQNQYKEVIDNAKNRIAVEAMDGSNAFHAQAGLMMAHDAATDLSSLEEFISLGIDANDYDIRGRTPLEAIITQPKDYENELTKSEKVSLLIDKGRASVHSRNRLGHTPLYSAAIRGLDRTVEVLLLHGSHVNIRANNNISLLDAVTDAWHRAFVEYLESRMDSKYHEAQCSRIEACKVLLERYGAISNPKPEQAMGYPAPQ